MDSFFLASYVVLWLVAIASSLLLVGLAREVALLRRQVGPEPGALALNEGPKLGAVLEPLNGADIRTGVRVSVPGGAGPSLVVFLSPSCPPCLQLIPDLEKIARSRRAQVIGIVLAGEQAVLELTNQFEMRFPVIADAHRELADAYAVKTTPFALAIDEDGVVKTKGIANGLGHLEALLHFQITLGTASPQTAGA